MQLQDYTTKASEFTQNLLITVRLAELSGKLIGTARLYLSNYILIEGNNNLARCIDTECQSFVRQSNNVIPTSMGIEERDGSVRGMLGKRS